ncbi:MULTISPECIES: arginine--tRNA ligase [Sporosarcina]|uniref:arginine--tRNA ligase n=1 Tax=Sporosarcina TaxID=1569 RepID=UPI00058E376E|nr:MULTISPECIES: arginine--tRNA ligase [Sporosarcina]WJY27536.1 arginine--tRNA ligase [Sporosarcina sp. 0.2-SM1T-5]
MDKNRMIAELLAEALDHIVSRSQFEQLLEKPKDPKLGDIAFPCYRLEKEQRKAPHLIAADLAGRLHHDLILNVTAVGPYVNISLDRQIVMDQVLQEILAAKEQYGSHGAMRGNVLIDYSSPNIAKPFSMGHLRSTVIGNALANIAEKNGFTPIRINHLGDWGTQFGKLIVAYRRWGDQAAIAESPIRELLNIYVKFHEAAETDDSLNEEARVAFKSLEDGDPEAYALWEWFREESLKEFEAIYELLGIRFDSYAGEAFYNDKMETVVQELKEKSLLTRSDGAHVVELEDLPPCLITKKDGATLYATRDLAAAIYRQQTYIPEKVLYVVGNEQSLHFKQLFTVLGKMGFGWSKNLTHVPFGMILQDGQKMSTRKGKIVLLADVLDEAIGTAKRNIEEKNPALLQKDKVAVQVGVGAVLFNDLKTYRLHDIDFSIEQMMNFEGETGPYVQYTIARISSLLTKGGDEEGTPSFDGLGESAWPVVKLLGEYPLMIQKAFDQADPSLIAKFSLKLSREFNKYYATTRVLEQSPGRQDRLAFVSCVRIVLKDALKLLGISSPDEM